MKDRVIKTGTDTGAKSPLSWKLEDAYCEIEGDLLNFLGIEVS